MKEGFQFREVINREKVSKIAQHIKEVWPLFNDLQFTDEINPIISSLGFNERAQLIADKLNSYLPLEYPQAIDILMQSFGPENEQNELTGFDIFHYMPHGAYVSKYGLDPEHFDLSMKAIYEITKRFSSESPIRAFLIQYPKKTLAQLEQWVADKNVHVRRLVSEGTRSRLPLAPRLKQFQIDPAPVLKLLEKLKADPELYVRRSVANNLNDIAKDNPDVVIQTLERWNKTVSADTRWLTQHALRSLVKSGNRSALELLGYPAEINIKTGNFVIKNPVINIGDTLEFSFELHSNSDKIQNLMIDYIIHFRKANNKLAPKVFKWTKKKLELNEQIVIRKAHSFKLINTRKYYTGMHHLELQINGQSMGMLKFDLKNE